MMHLNRKGFTLVEIMIVVAIIGLLVVIAIPNFVKARDTARKNLCINNLRLIDHAKWQYAIEANLDESAVATSAQIALYIRGEVFPTCPSAGTYAVQDMSNPATCTIAGHSLPSY